MSYRDESESFLRLVGVMVAWQIGLYARSKQADESDALFFFFYCYEKLPLLLGRRRSKPPVRSSTQSWPPTVAQ